VIETEITGRETPQARPKACFEGTKTYGTFCEETSVKHALHSSYLVLAKQGKMQQNFQGFSIGRHNNQLGSTAVERFGG